MVVRRLHLLVAGYPVCLNRWRDRLNGRAAVANACVPIIRSSTRIKVVARFFASRMNRVGGQRWLIAIGKDDRIHSGLARAVGDRER